MASTRVVVINAMSVVGVRLFEAYQAYVRAGQGVELVRRWPEREFGLLGKDVNMRHCSVVAGKVERLDFKRLRPFPLYSTI